MDKKTAIKTLLQHSSFFTEEVKSTILEKLDDMSEAELDSIGNFLALAKEKSLASAQVIKQAADEVLAEE